MTTMTKMRVAELEGAQLDWAVAMAEGDKPRISKYETDNDGCFEYVAEIFDLSEDGTHWNYYCPSLLWEHGGPIIERERIQVTPEISSCWSAYTFIIFPTEKSIASIGKTPLIAAMRAFCASKLGDEVEVPE